MKKYICTQHDTQLKKDDNGNIKIIIKYQNLGCHLPRMEKLKEKKITDCNIKEVEVNG